ncbi:unnamed protein product, partial [Ectocarpus fasciculatus]
MRSGFCRRLPLSSLSLFADDMAKGKDDLLSFFVVLLGSSLLTQQAGQGVGYARTRVSFS